MGEPGLLSPADSVDRSSGACLLYGGSNGTVVAISLPFWTFWALVVLAAYSLDPV